jgi:hypothetical protein
MIDEYFELIESTILAFKAIISGNRQPAVGSHLEGIPIDLAGTDHDGGKNNDIKS